MNEQLPELASKAAESAIKALSPTKSTYYFPVSVAVIALCWVTGEADGFVWWMTDLILLSAIVGLTYLAWKSRLELRGASVADEFRAARTIALSGAFITLVSALHVVAKVPWAATFHLLACSLQIFTFFIVAWKDQGKPASPPRVNLIQLTLILSALLGGGAYMLGKAANTETIVANALVEVSEAKSKGDQRRQEDHFQGATDAEILADREVTRTTAMKTDMWSYRVIAFGLYGVWLTTGVAWFRSRQSKPLRSKENESHSHA